MRFNLGNRVLAALVAFLLLGILGPWWIWGDKFDAALTLEGSIGWMRAQGDWAWLAGLGLLVADLALPIPSTIVMSAFGVIYGALLGGILAGTGSMLAGVVAYALSRWAGRPMAVRFAGEEGLARTEALFAKGGAWLVLTSRWLPILSEAVACLAGLARMPFRTFLAALGVGSLPVGFAFAGIGAIAREQESLAVALSITLPLIAWLAGRRIRR